jgi:hypothetical protein
MSQPEVEIPSTRFGREEVLPNYLLRKVYNRLELDQTTIADQMDRLTRETIEHAGVRNIDPRIATAAAILRLEKLTFGAREIT